MSSYEMATKAWLQAEMYAESFLKGGAWIDDARPTENKELDLQQIRVNVAEAVLKYAAGFVYFVSVLGITGTKSASEEAVREHVSRIKRHTRLPVAVGFGIKTPEQAAAVARHADAAVVGSAIVDQVKVALDAAGKPTASLVPGVLDFVKSLAQGVRSVKKA